ncbi:MAG: M48 family metallopeptidase [Candidatus Marinimicrobia bacterium]|nr:M48 family metallopeptidase [Candidatus Neomarinimicrobiota bacterium]MBL7022516.1 M48 family metallopeptidase [Candidatus Neomarinimicrobiota bacterium]MBL7108629.1 M48 family metallopeptidase [Candidatus Neomarinimicrobiota bacterium]
MNIYFIIIITAILVEFLLGCISKLLNLRALNPVLPEEFIEFYDEEKYAKSQEYTRENTRFGFIISSLNLIIILVMILFGGFDYLDKFVRGFEFTSPITNGLVYFAILFFVKDILMIPFSLYANFVIEEKYGFNKMTYKTFISDKLKSYLITIILGGLVMSGILFFFENTGELAWLYAWIAVSVFSVLIQPLYNAVIAPMFNKFTPLEDGELKNIITNYTQKVKFPITRIDVMDGSRRSSHSNAYFSGFGKRKRIALFDTLIEKHSTNELLGILAHEVGHYKKRHILKGIIISVIHSGILFFLMSLFLKNRELFDAFKMTDISVYAGLLFFSILYTPVELVLGLALNALSRKHEFEADAFASETTNSTESMISGLKRLSAENLSNLTPHPLTVALSYSHPPVLKRIKALQKFTIK